MGYTKQFLIDAFMWRYQSVLEQDSPEEFDKYYKMISDQYDRQGKEAFRTYASLDAAAVQEFRLATGS